MNKGSRLVHFGLAVLVMLLTVGVTYADQGLYVDAAFGRANVDNEIAGIFLEDDSEALRFGLGYDLGNNISVEAGYVFLGEVEADVLGVANEGETDGGTLAARFELPLTDTLNASARIGGFFWEAELATPDGTFVNEGEDLFYGFGVDFKATDRLSLSGQWDRFEFGDSEADVIWAGLRYRF
ncbi:MAG: outer membrane beta-barrel protein [Gammaproteobacteria bacterium]